MTRIYAVLATVFFTAFFIYGCSSDGSNEVKSIMNKQADITENYVNGLEGAQDSDDVVKVIEQYTESMKKLIPELKEFQKNHPEFQQGKMPEAVQADVERIKALSEKIPQAMMKVAGYMQDSKVQEAMVRMGQEMRELQ